MESDYPRHVVASGLLVRRDDLVLLVRTPARGWEFPGGQIELGESVTDGVLREIREEANVEAVVDQLVGVYSNIDDSRVMLDFLGTWVSGEASVGDETIDVAWTSLEDARRRIEHPLYSRRLRQLLEYDGRVLYQSYSKNPYTVRGEQFV